MACSLQPKGNTGSAGGGEAGAGGRAPGVVELCFPKKVRGICGMCVGGNSEDPIKPSSVSLDLIPRKR